jgi:hypothetical protein
MLGLAVGAGRTEDLAPLAERVGDAAEGHGDGA